MPKPVTPDDYVGNMVYRPFGAENALDVEVSIDVTFTMSSPGYAQIHARVQPSVVNKGQLDGYIFFIDGTINNAVLSGLSPAAAPLTLAAAFVLGTIGLAAVGSLFGVLAEAPRAREAVFPLLVLPLATPVLVASVRATALATAARAGEAGSWLGLLLAFDLVFVSVGTLVFGFLLEE